ncbi:RDD family protein [Mesobacillus zeae]|uniref:RDD family protein n=1 Tax=Mesobacillus zeae TaxID=1917180 RepID=A0A398BGM0_9BACI|nr:RDD family protein [Mesobacillus zeae]RID87818.1 RDD family protein [Mesobacillus zeae]
MFMLLGILPMWLFYGILYLSLVFIVCNFVSSLYFSILHCSKWQATIGKKLLELKMTDYEGRKISFWRASGRQFATVLSYLLLFGYIMAGFTAKKQSLHDLIARTLVIKR